MILNLNSLVYVSIIIFWLVKICCKTLERKHKSMYNKQPLLTSIPERNESEEEVIKWVPKKKHEILKAKYKCLKKLFQIYDASVIGILPETYAEPEPIPEPRPHVTHRRKRSYRTKTDASAGTRESSSGDISQSGTEENTIASAVIKDLTSYSTIQGSKSKTTICNKDDKSTQDTKENVSVANAKTDSDHTEPYPVPYLMVNEKRKLTRFQSFIQRLLGIRRDSCYVLDNTRVYAVSDNNISTKYEKRRRRGIRFRRSRRPKKIHSDIALGESPVILSYVQTVQRNCLMDTTPRQCPIAGCKRVFYGIISYNDHLNLCHFPERKHICHYCHEGFTRHCDKIQHENEHIGMMRLATPHGTPTPERCSKKIASDTQTDPELSKIDVPDEKLKKIVSFFDKISDPDQIIAEIKKNRCSETNMETLHVNANDESTDSETMKSDSDNRTVSGVNLQHKSGTYDVSSMGSEMTSKNACDAIKCRICDEHFDYRRQNSLHVDLVHRVHDKLSKFHSCAGIINRNQDADTKSERSCTDLSEMTKKSEETLNYDTSTNIIYYTSTESVNKKPSTVNSIVQKVRNGFCYKWEPGTKIIRV